MAGFGGRNRPLLPTVGATPEEQRSLSGLGAIVRMLLDSGSFLQRVRPGSVHRAASGIALAWGEMNRLPAVPALAILPRITQRTIGIPLTITKQGASGIVRVQPGPGLSGRQATVNGQSTGFQLTEPGQYTVMADAENWFPLTRSNSYVTITNNVSGGDVFGPAGSASGTFPIFGDTTGKLLADSGFGPADIVARTRYEAWFGSGEDGSPSPSGITTLTKPTFYSSWAPVASGFINTAGYPLKIQRLDTSKSGCATGCISRNGINGITSTNAASGLTHVYLGGSGVGSQGGAGGAPNTAGSAAGAATVFDLGNGGIAGSGGNGGAGNGGKVGGAGRAGTFPTARAPHQGIQEIPPILNNANGTTFRVLGGGVGGGGGGGGGGSSGINSGAAGNGGAGAAGVLECWIGELITGPSTPASIFMANGGRGGDPVGVPAGGGGGGGAGGGGGGVARVFIGKRTGPVVTNIITASGGNGGYGGTASSGGANGGGGGSGGGGEVLAAVLTSASGVFYRARQPSGIVASGIAGGIATPWGLTL